MNDYTALRVDLSPCDTDTTDLLAAFLADAGYESFEADTEGLTAYIPVAGFDVETVKNILDDFPMEVKADISHVIVEGKDWNREWEKNYFRPIVIDDECVIHSTFHTDVPEARYDIVIDPKMAFGTGHHATTSMMIRHLLDLPVENAVVTDMGSGTGILAILAAMRGAASVGAIEIDPGACRNAEENIALNSVSVKMLEGDAARLKELPQADIFLANINRNIILADLERYSNAISPGGLLVISGFYEADIPLIERSAALSGFTVEQSLTMPDPNLTEADPALSHGNWASLRLRKQNR